MLSRKISKIIFISVLFFSLPLFANADSVSQQVKFYVDSSYDLTKRDQVSATLQKVTNFLYFYIDDKWWGDLGLQKRSEVFEKLNNLTEEFENKIYPTLTSNFGSEWTPGIDNDIKITILIHPMKKEAGGYFNSGDEYLKIQNPKSNEREMVYLNSEYIYENIFKSFLAHEFTHLISFNQKEKNYGVSEETWLNEARAEYSPTLVGYDDSYEGSNLENRIKIFLERPYDSLIEWKNEKADYGVVNLFTQYLVDHYGVRILFDSLRDSKTGIESINYALRKNGFQEDFSQIFTNWSITVLLNDCSQGEKYCYLNQNLKSLRIVPQLNFLPLIGESSLQFTNAFYDWSASWYKIIGGKEKIILEFDGQDEAKLLVNYLLCDFQDKCQIQFLTLNEKQEGKILLTDFNKNYQSLIIISTIQTKISGFDGMQPTYLFTWKVSSIEKTEEEKEVELRERLLAQIEFLKAEIAKIQAQINKILGKSELVISCQRIERNLYFGLRNDAQVRCLQEFLNSLESEIYPEGLITGNFLSLTQTAVIRFQEKYVNEILKPLGLEKGTGFVGSLTRAKINQLLGK
ncbi:hypothetical protein AMJ49_00970 [Parcubacteria bacterium DG_74_2]|nr:MAG: hypothetical protein AMJ49_00970 [Parcubacteria bacterium DG_74_2]